MLSVHTHGQVFDRGRSVLRCLSTHGCRGWPARHHIDCRDVHLISKKSIDVMSGQVQIAVGPSGVSLRVRETQVVHRLA